MLRIVLCARESAIADWHADLARACAAAGIDCTISRRDAQDPQPAPDAPQADIAVVWRPPAAFFTEQRQLKLIFGLGAGVDGFLQLPTVPVDVPLVRLEDAGMASVMADYVLAAALRFALHLERYRAQQREQQWHPLSPRVPADVQAGVLGLGAIGAPIAERLVANGFAVRGYARSPRRVEGVACFSEADGLEAFLDGLDLLVSVLPLTPQNRGLLDRGRLARLAPGAHLINVGRGAHVVEADLLALLDSGHLGGATLDVFADEPLPATHPFWRHPAITVTPHISGITPRAPAVAQIAQKIARWQRGEPVSGMVDRARGY
jgi:glyoxylate/hydroxypyruvate reductase A